MGFDVIMENKKKITMDLVRIENLSRAHEKIIENFQSYEPELMKFLKEDALDNQEKNRKRQPVRTHPRKNHEEDSKNRP